MDSMVPPPGRLHPHLEAYRAGLNRAVQIMGCNAENFLLDCTAELGSTEALLHRFVDGLCRNIDALYPERAVTAEPFGSPPRLSAAIGPFEGRSPLQLPLPTSALGHARRGSHDSHFTDNLLRSPTSLSNELRPVSVSLAQHGTGNADTPILQSFPMHERPTAIV